jgi:ABC-type oligopeptide transport system substrate-binding subunit
MIPEQRAKARAFAEGGQEAVNLVEELLRRRIDRRQFISRATVLGLSAVSAGTILTACGSSAAPSPVGPSTAPKPPTKTLTWRPVADVENVDPAILPGLEDPTYVQCFFESLLAYVPGTNKVVHCLADTFETSSDGLRFTSP